MNGSIGFDGRWLSVDPQAPPALHARAFEADPDGLVIAGPGSAAALLVVAARASGLRARLFCCVSPAASASLDDDLDAIVALAPDGVVLSGCGGRADVQQLSIRLALCEARAGVNAGSISVIASVAQTPDSIFRLGGLAGASRRLTGLVFDPASLRLAMVDGFDPHGGSVAVARSLVVFAAAAAGVPCLAFAPSGSKKGFEAFCVAMQAEGFSGAIAADPDQLSGIARIFGQIRR